MRRAEKFLSRLRSTEEMITRRLQMMDEIRLSLLPGGIDYAAVKVQTTPRDRMADEMAKLADEYYKLLDLVENDQRKKREVMEIISRLEPLEQKIVFMKFRDEMSLTAISESVRFSYRHTQRVYKRILDKVEGYIGADNEKNLN